MQCMNSIIDICSKADERVYSGGGGGELGGGGGERQDTLMNLRNNKYARASKRH